MAHGTARKEVFRGHQVLDARRAWIAATSSSFIWLCAGLVGNRYWNSTFFDLYPNDSDTLSLEQTIIPIIIVTSVEQLFFWWLGFSRVPSKVNGIYEGADHNFGTTILHIPILPVWTIAHIALDVFITHLNTKNLPYKVEVSWAH